MWTTKFRKACFVGVVAIAAGAIVLAIHSIQPVSWAQSQKPVTIYALTCPSGTGEFEMFPAINEVLKKSGSWLSIEGQETQGYVYNTRVMIDDPGRYRHTIAATDLINLHNAKNKVNPYPQGLKEFRPKVIFNPPWPAFVLLAIDPKIRTLDDLVGKRVASTPKGGTCNVLFEALLKANDLHDKVKLMNVGFGEVVTMVNDGNADVAVTGMSYNAVSHKTAPWTALLDAMASGKNYHVVQFGREKVKRLQKTVPALDIIIPKGTIPILDFDVEGYTQGGMYAADPTFPDEYAYELLKRMVDNMEQIKTYGGFAGLLSSEYLTFGRPTEEWFHPGALKFYKERGLIPKLPEK